MAPDLMEAELRQRAERLLCAFDFARCLGCPRMVANLLISMGEPGFQVVV
jgi:hypothetical protein